MALPMRILTKIATFKFELPARPLNNSMLLSNQLQSLFMAWSWSLAVVLERVDAGGQGVVNVFMKVVLAAYWDLGYVV